MKCSATWPEAGYPFKPDDSDALATQLNLNALVFIISKESNMLEWDSS